MTTRQQLRDMIRGELNDTGAAPLWPDARLNQWIGEALREYGLALPRAASTTLASVAGQEAYALPADLITVTRVEHPAGSFRTFRPKASGEEYPSPDNLQPALAQQPAYDVYGGSLLLHPAPGTGGQNIAVRYLARYAEPALDTDVLATPGSDDQILLWKVASKALRWITTDEAKRQRFERERGAGAAEAARDYEERYGQGVKERRGLISRRLAIRD